MLYMLNFISNTQFVVDLKLTVCCLQKELVLESIYKCIKELILVQPN